MLTRHHACISLAGMLVCAAVASGADPRRDLPETGAHDSAKVVRSTDEQIALLGKRISQASGNVALQNLLATAYLQKVRETVDFGYLDRAEQILIHVLASDEGNYEALRMRGVIELERHHFQTAAELSDTLIHLHPNDPWNYGVLGDAAMERGEYERAAGAYQRMLALRPDQSSLNRASWYEFVSGHPQQAIALMTEAVRAGAQAPENTAWCLVDLGNLFFKTGAMQEAETAYTNAAHTFPGYHAAEAGLGRIAAAQNKYAEAIGHYRKAQASVPLPDYTAALEELYSLSNDAAESRKQRDLLEFTDRMGRLASEKTNRNLALIYADESRNLDRALELIQEEFKVRNDVYTHDAEAWVLFQRKDYARARDASLKALSRGTPEPAFYYHAGRIAAALDDKPEARRLLRRALELNPKFDLRQSAIAAELLKSL